MIKFLIQLFCTHPTTSFKMSNKFTNGETQWTKECDHCGKTVERFLYKNEGLSPKF